MAYLPKTLAADEKWQDLVAVLQLCLLVSSEFSLFGFAFDAMFGTLGVVLGTLAVVTGRQGKKGAAMAGIVLGILVLVGTVVAFREWGAGFRQ
jgi:hypothetical protein